MRERERESERERETHRARLTDMQHDRPVRSMSCRSLGEAAEPEQTTASSFLLTSATQRLAQALVAGRHVRNELLNQPASVGKGT